MALRQNNRNSDQKIDPFVRSLASVYHGLVAYRWPLGIILGVSIFGILVLSVWNGFQERDSKRMAERIFKATQEGRDGQEKLFIEIQREKASNSLGSWVSLELSHLKGQDSCEFNLSALKTRLEKEENALLKSLLYAKVGDCYFKKQDWAQAESLYLKASVDTQNLLKDWSSLRLAEAKKQLGKLEESQKILKGLSQEKTAVSASVLEEAKMTLLFP